jgi:nitrilase
MPAATVAVVQAGTPLFDTPATLDKLERLAGEAAGAGAALALFPEGFVGGYPKGMDFGARLGGRTEAGRDQFRRYWESAIAVPGPETARIGEAAARHAMQLVVGVIERGGATLYCTVLFFAADGALLGKHRKLVPTAMERILWGQGDGSTMPVLKTPIGRVGAVICWENYMPLLRAHMYAQGVEIYCAPTVDDRDTWPLSMRHIAFEGRCFVASAVPYLDRSMLPPDYPGDMHEDVLIRGGSIICGPMGEVLAGPLYGREGVLVAQVDVETLPRAKYDLDVVGHYARPDLFRLEVDTRPRALR